MHLTLSGPSVKHIRHPALPPQEEIKNGNYWFSPCTVDEATLDGFSPFYMHCFLNPGDHTRNGGAVRALPKKLHQSLCVSQSDSSLDPEVPAWGVWVVDGPDYTRLSLFAAIGVLVTTIITCVWSGVMGDVQGATGIGQYLLALVTVMSAATLWNLHFTY